MEDTSLSELAGLYEGPDITGPKGDPGNAGPVRDPENAAREGPASQTPS